MSGRYDVVIVGGGHNGLVAAADLARAGKSVVVRDFRVQSATRGKDAQGESIVEVEYEGQIYRGRGVSTDTVEAATRAFLNAINRIEIGANPAERARNRATGAGTINDPYPRYDELRETGPVHEAAISSLFGLAEAPDNLAWRDRRQFSCFDWQTVDAVLRESGRAQRPR